MPKRGLESAHLISEKILQRYVFEKLSESASTRRNLLPHRLESKAATFKVLIPEYDLADPTHRADFRLIFKDKSAWLSWRDRSSALLYNAANVKPLR